MKNSDEFSNSEEQEAKRRAERCEKAEDLKERKCKIKSEEDKIQEGEMWNRLNELNGEFKKIRQFKKEAKKMSATIL